MSDPRVPGSALSSHRTKGKQFTEQWQAECDHLAAWQAQEECLLVGILHELRSDLGAELATVHLAHEQGLDPTALVAEAQRHAEEVVAYVARQWSEALVISMHERMEQARRDPSSRAPTRKCPPVGAGVSRG